MFLDVKIHTPEEKAPVRLTLHHKPFTCSFGYLSERGEKFILLDPSRQESHVLEGAISIAVNKHREICALHLSGQSELSPDKIVKTVKMAVAKVAELQALVDGGIKKDDKLRKKGTIPQLSVDLFETGDANGLMLLDEMAKVIAECNNVEQQTQTVKTEVMQEDVKQEVSNEQDIVSIYTEHDPLLFQIIGNSHMKCKVIDCDKKERFSQTDILLQSIS